MLPTAPLSLPFEVDRGLSRLLHTELHWLDLPEPVTYKIGVITFCCQHGRALPYLIDYCLPVSAVTSRHGAVRSTMQSRSSGRNHVTVSARMAAVADPTVWNSLPGNLRDPDDTMDNFIDNVKRLLKTFLFSAFQCN